MVGACPSRTSASGKFLVDMYLRWKTRFVVTSGNQSRVVRPENQTVSEGIGYGMLIAVYMGDRTLFDGLYAYWVAHPANTGDSNTLMDWCVNGGGGNGSTGTSCNGDGSATDADEDAAWALIQAGKQWGGALRSECIGDGEADLRQRHRPNRDSQGRRSIPYAQPDQPVLLRAASARSRASTRAITNSAITASYAGLQGQRGHR